MIENSLWLGIHDHSRQEDAMNHPDQKKSQTPTDKVEAHETSDSDPSLLLGGVSEGSDYHQVSKGCPKGYTQQCGTGYRT